MTTRMEDRLMKYANALRGAMPLDKFLDGAMLIFETKKELTNKGTSKEAAYEAMLLIADKLRIQNPFENADRFYSILNEVDADPDWEELLYKGILYDKMGSILVPKALLAKMAEAIEEGKKNILITEAEKFVPNLKSLIDEHNECAFTLTSQNTLYVRTLEKIFDGYKNVSVVNTNIYTYGFVNEKFDFILSVPVFGGRNLAADSSNFICREYDMVALENLSLHISAGGKLVIVMPARITFAGGRVKELRDFITKMYKLEEIAELPNGIFQKTGIKTVLLVIGDGKTEDVVVRRYEASDRKTKRGPISSLELKDDTFSMLEEIQDIGDWSIDKLLAQQDEEYMKYQASDIRKIALGDIAEIFRGKTVTKKEMDGDIGVVNITNIGQYEINYDSLDTIDVEERKIRNYILQEGDVVIPARGTAIRSAIFHEQKYTCIASSNVIVIRPAANKLDSTYLKNFIDSAVGKSIISSLQQGMAVMNISYKDLELMEVPFPSYKEQREVAEEYEKAYKKYVKTITDAESNWNETLTKLQQF